ncbi:MAG: hypothetical protein ACXWR0_01710 [Bdellovibrio sp.]
MTLIRFFLVFSLFSCVVIFNAWSQDAGSIGSRNDEAHETEIAQKVKKRLYPGGKDEEDLKVQAQVSNPTRKLAPQAEIKEEPVEE